MSTYAWSHKAAERPTLTNPNGGACGFLLCCTSFYPTTSRRPPCFTCSVPLHPQLQHPKGKRKREAGPTSSNTISAAERMQLAIHPQSHTAESVRNGTTHHRNNPAARLYVGGLPKRIEDFEVHEFFRVGSPLSLPCAPHNYESRDPPCRVHPEKITVPDAYSNAPFRRTYSQ
jgi:hypothetical protein